MSEFDQPDCPSLPSDFLVEVLLRLPAKTLANLRSVSKSWRALIDSPEFIRMHASSGHRAPSLTFLIFPPSHSQYTTAGCLDSHDGIEATRTKIQGPLDSIISYYGSCNGLICLGKFPSRPVLWNPLTKQHKELPPDKYPRLRCDEVISFGFGHDVGHDDYKVVKLSQFYAGPRKPSDQQVQIYSLKSNSWREISKSPYGFSGDIIHDGVFANGALHWLMVDVYDNNCIMALDLTTEKYRVVRQPKDIDSGKISSFTAFDGCLCLMVYGHKGQKTELWTMTKYGVEDSWAKMNFRLPLSSYQTWDSLCCKLIACNGKILLFLNLTVLTWYDTENGRLQKLQVFNAADHKPSTTLMDGCVFTRTLVKLP